MSKKLTHRRINVNLHREEAAVIDRIEDEGGSYSEIIRQMIREYGRDKYPQEKMYAKAMMRRLENEQRKQEAKDFLERISPEDYTTNILRGKVDGKYAVFRLLSGADARIPLTDIKKQTVENNQIIERHNLLLDGTYKLPNGKLISDMERERILRGWFEEEESEE